MLMIALAILIAYLIGSIPTSYIIARFKKGIDIRNHGSGNVGATNLLRTVGKWPAILALLLDALKGIVPVTLVAFIFSNADLRLDFDIFRYLLGLAAISGHIWPVFLKFRGGKGVATSAGVIMVISPLVFGISLGVCLLTIAVFRFVSLGSIMAAISLPIVAALLGKPVKLVVFFVIICVITSYKHKTNVRRLVRNEEPRIGERLKVK